MSHGHLRYLREWLALRRVDIGCVDALVITGHSPGNCTFHHPGLDAMFTGDTPMTRDPMFGVEGPVVFGEDPADDALCLASLELLRPYGDAALLPGHGDPDPAAGALGTAMSEACIAVPV